MALEERVHITMNDVEEGYEERDDSRPFFQRQACEVGIYMTVFDATPIDEKSIGLDHYFRMKTTEILHDEFNKLDIVNIRAAFDERNILTDMYIERFEPGIVMAVGFDNVETLDALWILHKQNKLTAMMHDILITSGDLKAASITEVTLVSKLWDDEYDLCKQELMARATKMPRLDIEYRPNDMKMVRRLKAYQKVMALEILSMRDVDNEMEVKRSDFMNCIRNLLTDDNDGIATLSEYEELNDSHKARNMYHKDLLDKFSTTIQKWRTYYKTFGHEILVPLRQMHKVCENEKQVNIKAKIINSVMEMQIMLQADFELKGVRHPEMAKKIIRREWPVFLGLLSLVPIGTERTSDIDILIDDYMREFNLDLKV